MKNITGLEIVERLPVKAVCEGREQLLGVPITGRTGKEVAATVFKLLVEWELESHVVSCCFDTTNVNSGRLKGAGVNLERELAKSLQFMPCRHHMYELVLKAVYMHHMGGTKKPTVPLFDRFKAEWGSINPKTYVPGIAVPEIAKSLEHSKNNIKHYILMQLIKDICRFNYLFKIR